MAGEPFIQGEDVTLRTIEKDDLGFLQRAHNRPAYRRTMPRETPTNRLQLQQYYKEVVSGDDSVNLLVWSDSERVGVINHE